MNKQQELDALRAELEDYRQEKEQIRKVIGVIGGNEDRKRDKALNWTIMVVLLSIFVIDILNHFFHIAIPVPPIFSLEVGMFLISLKIVIMIHKQSHVEHFQFWILNSIEFRINSIAKRLRNIEQTLAALADNNHKD
jgi:hypothetical protein